MAPDHGYARLVHVRVDGAATVPDASRIAIERLPRGVAATVLGADLGLDGSYLIALVAHGDRDDVERYVASIARANARPPDGATKH